MSFHLLRVAVPCLTAEYERAAAAAALLQQHHRHAYVMTSSLSAHISHIRSAHGLAPCHPARRESLHSSTVLSPGTLTPLECSSLSILQHHNLTALVIFMPFFCLSAGCPAGTFAAGVNTCRDCPKGSFCLGGRYTGEDNNPPATSCSVFGAGLTTLGIRTTRKEGCGKS